MISLKPIVFSLAIAWLCFFSDNALAQQTAQKFIRETDYLLSLPDGYQNDTSKRWPLMIFLHGSGESGNDLEKVKANGPPKLVAAGKKFPFIIVSPQAHLPEGWEPDNLYHLLLYTKQTYRVDETRIYLTGLSMGGFGTWALAIKHPEEFAAIMPICGGGDTAQAWRLRYVPVWCFHGALDNVVPIASDERMVNATKAYNTSVKFTVYPDANHNSWERTYNNDSVYQWLLAQKKFVYKEIKLNQKILKDYTGTFAGEHGDTIIISNDTARLHAKTAEDIFLLKPSTENIFFIFDNLPIDIKFIRNTKGNCDSFIIYEDDKSLYRRIK
jgi:pimeloyl-ACP methyl ester carboxylesterase